MKKCVLFAALVFVFAIAPGCDSAKTNIKKLTLTNPADQVVEQGGTEKVTVLINRDHFTDPVTVRLEGLPSGVQVKEKEIIIGSDSTSADFTLQADASAAEAKDNRVTINADAKGVSKVTESFLVTVRKKP